MKKVFLAFLLGGSLVAQQPAKPQQPRLGTADQVAIQTLEKAKADAQKQYREASEAEATVATEWAAAHPGWHLNMISFAVEQDPIAPPSVKK